MFLKCDKQSFNEFSKVNPHGVISGLLYSFDWVVGRVGESDHQVLTVRASLGGGGSYSKSKHGDRHFESQVLALRFTWYRNKRHTWQ